MTKPRILCIEDHEVYGQTVCECLADELDDAGQVQGVEGRDDRLHSKALVEVLQRFALALEPGDLGPRPVLLGLLRILLGEGTRLEAERAGQRANVTGRIGGKRDHLHLGQDQSLCHALTAPHQRDGKLVLTLPEHRFLGEITFNTAEIEREGINYIKHAMRRFMITLEMIPPATSPESELLELGANPYFITLLLLRFRNYRITCANYFGKEGPLEGKGKQS